MGMLKSGLKNVAGQMGVSTKATDVLTKSFGAAAGAAGLVTAGVVAAVNKLNKLSEEAARYVDDLNTMANQYHMTAEELQKLSYAAEFVDVDLQTMTGSISRLTRSMGEAQKGTGGAAEAFAKLGVSVTNADGSLRDSREVFYDTIDALGRINSTTEQDTLAMEVFGRSAMDLRGIIDEGSAGLRAYGDEAEQLGIVLTEEENKRLQELQDAQDKTDQMQEAANRKIAAWWAGPRKVFEDFKFFLADLSLAVATDLNKTADTTDTTGDAFLRAAKHSGILTKEMEGIPDAAKEAADALTAVGNAADSALAKYKTWKDEATSAYREQVSHLTELKKMRDELYATGNTQEGYDVWLAMQDYMKETGVTQYNQTGQFASVNVTLEVDGDVLARTTVDNFTSESNRRGRNLIREP